MNIPQIMDIFKNLPLISVFQTTPRVGWASQGFDVPIPAVRDMRVLLRFDNLDDEDCLSLGDEVEQRLSEGHAKRRGDGINVFGVRTPATPPPSNSLAATEADLTATSLSQAARAPPIFPQGAHAQATNFPLTYVVDMIPGLQQIQEAIEAEKESSEPRATRNAATKLLELFSECFPNCQFVRSTFYHALNLYSRALEVEGAAGVIAKYLLYGDTPKGMWKEFRKEVNREFLIFLFNCVGFQ